MDTILCIIIIVSALLAASAAVLLCTAVYFFRLTVLRKPTATLENNINANTDWTKHLDFIKERREWLEAQPLERVSTVSYDGLKLNGYYLQAPTQSKKLVLCFHGYTSNALSNWGGIIKFYSDSGVNALMVDARAHGESEGKYIGFGVLDRKDALKWISFCVERFGNDVEIYLHGISMGGATVLMTSGLDLPKNVKGIVADCAFTSANDVFSHILKRDYHLPGFPLMNITDMLTKRFAGYGYNDVNTLNEVKRTKVPIVFIHGDKDDFVPTYMTEQNYAACASQKKMHIVKDADHAEAYYLDRERYESLVRELMGV